MISPDLINVLVLAGILSIGYWCGRVLVYLMERF